MRVAIIALLVATIALGAWGVGELHYRNCVNAAKASPPQREADRYDFRSNPFAGRDQTVDRAKLQSQVAGCSRIP